MTAVEERRLEAQVLPPAGPWTELRAAPHRPVHTAIARTILHRAVRRMPLRVVLPDGLVLGAGDARSPVMRIRSDDFFRRLGAQGLVGFGEAYMAGDWDADDPAEVLVPFARRLTVLVPQWMQRLRRLYVQHQPTRERNTLAGARRNIARHYDLSNDLFALFLDESMTYSSAWFEPGDTLERAQMRKVDRLLDATGVGAGTRVLEIGTGWGALAIRAAQRGATVTSITLSAEQAALAERRIEDAGVADRVEIRICDYREIDGWYDTVVSVEMIEAVGEQYWPAYFSSLERVLAPGGRIGIQAILLEHDRLLATRDQYTWIHKYIFPGGALPSLEAIDGVLARHTGLHVSQTSAFGHHYATTLREWRARFDAHAGAVDALGFDLRFRRMWDFYLAYCEAGFATGYLDVAQLVLSRP
jgi:cyclopropane-fatty-acyl-phospholipid synthase